MRIEVCVCRYVCMMDGVMEMEMKMRIMIRVWTDGCGGSRNGGGCVV